MYCSVTLTTLHVLLYGSAMHLDLCDASLNEDASLGKQKVLLTFDLNPSLEAFSQPLSSFLTLTQVL